MKTQILTARPDPRLDLESAIRTRSDEQILVELMNLCRICKTDRMDCEECRSEFSF